MLLGGINEGPLLVNFIGHGSVEFWRGDLLTSDDAEGLINAYRSFFLCEYDVFEWVLSRLLIRTPWQRRCSRRRGEEPWQSGPLRG